MNKDKLDFITRRIIGCAITVHREVGPGLLESAYQRCLAAELKHEGLQFQQQVDLPLSYRGQKLDCGYRMDFVVENEVIVEIKAEKDLSAIDRAQLLSYLRISKRHVGLLINFHEVVLKDGAKRIVNDSPDAHAASVS
jgi:GxxExxY protein